MKPAAILIFFLFYMLYIKKILIEVLLIYDVVVVSDV